MGQVCKWPHSNKWLLMLHPHKRLYFVQVWLCVKMYSWLLHIACWEIINTNHQMPEMGMATRNITKTKKLRERYYNRWNYLSVSLSLGSWKKNKLLFFFQKSKAPIMKFGISFSITIKHWITRGVILNIH